MSYLNLTSHYAQTAFQASLRRRDLIKIRSKRVNFIFNTEKDPLIPTSGGRLYLFIPQMSNH